MDFNEWWHNIGSGITPAISGDLESHTKHVANVAWNTLQAENKRLKAELADSLPLQKVREMVSYCETNRADTKCQASCPYNKLCEFLGDLTSRISCTIIYKRYTQVLPFAIITFSRSAMFHHLPKGLHWD